MRKYLLNKQDNLSFKEIYHIVSKRILIVCFVLTVLKVIENYAVRGIGFNSTTFWISAGPTFLLGITFWGLFKNKTKESIGFLMITLPMSLISILIVFGDPLLLLIADLLVIGSFLVFTKNKTIFYYNIYLLVALLFLFFSPRVLNATPTFAVADLRSILIFYIVQFAILYISRIWFLNLFSKVNKENKVLIHNNEQLQLMQKELLANNERLLLQNKAVVEQFTSNNPARFVSIISHDVKAPLLAIKNVFEFTKNDKTNKQIVSLLPEVRNTINNTVTLLNNLLAWGKHSFSEEKEATKLVNASALLPKILELSNLTIIDNKIKVIVRLEDKTWIDIHEEILKTILRNVINNAVKFCTQNGTIKVTAKKIDNAIVVEVLNNAYHISDTQIHLLNSSDNEPIKNLQRELGSGVGLLVVKDFVKKAKGTIAYSIHENEFIKCTLTFKASNVRILTSGTKEADFLKAAN